MFITDSQLLSYQRCSRKAFLDVYGNLKQQESPSDFLKKLIRDSSEFRASIINNYNYQEPNYPHGNLIAAAKATELLMTAGVDVIYKGILMIQQSAIKLSPQNQIQNNNFPAINFVSHPDLLIKQPGYSRFGDWTYIPTDIKLSKRPKLEYQIVGAFHAQILASVQECLPETARLILRKQRLYEVNLQQRLEQMQQTISELINMLQNSQEPEVFISRQKCHLCTWYNSCHIVAENQKHLSLLPGVTPNRLSLIHI